MTVKQFPPVQTQRLRRFRMLICRFCFTLFVSGGHWVQNRIHQSSTTSLIHYLTRAHKNIISRLFLLIWFPTEMFLPKKQPMEMKLPRALVKIQSQCGLFNHFLLVQRNRQGCRLVTLHVYLHPFFCSSSFLHQVYKDKCSTCKFCQL